MVAAYLGLEGKSCIPTMKMFFDFYNALDVIPHGLYYTIGIRYPQAVCQHVVRLLRAR